MGLWLYMLAVDLLIPLVMVIFGAIFTRRPPKNINGFYGYRTRRSMESPEAWRYAHQVFGQTWMRWGTILLLATLTLFLILRSQPENAVGAGLVICLVQLVVMFLAMFPPSGRSRSVRRAAAKRQAPRAGKSAGDLGRVHNLQAFFPECVDESARL